MGIIIYKFIFKLFIIFLIVIRNRFSIKLTNPTLSNVFDNLSNSLMASDSHLFNNSGHFYGWTMLIINMLT